MNFKDPWILVLIPFVLAGVWFWHRRQPFPSFYFSTTSLFGGVKKSWKVFLSENLIVIRWLVIILFMLALAGPRSVLEETKRTTEGIDIVLSLDCSGTMAAEDFTLNGQRINRLGIVKNVIRDFIKGKSSDRIGLVAFSALAYTVCPLTTDYDWVIENLDRIDLGIIEDGTAIGSGIASALSRLRNSTAKSKVIILLTDGINNAGKVVPLDAAQIAKKLGIKIYTIGVGTKGVVPIPVRDDWGRTFYQRVVVSMDEETLAKIAELTNGKYFRATDADSLKKIYQEIDALERTKIEEVGYKEYKLLFGFFLFPALALFLVEIILANTVLLRVP